MDIASASMELSQINTLSKAGTAVLGKSLDMAEQEGAGLLKMMDSASLERSINPSVGSNFDMVV